MEAKAQVHSPKSPVGKNVSPNVSKDPNEKGSPKITSKNNFVDANTSVNVDRENYSKMQSTEIESSEGKTNHPIISVDIQKVKHNNMFSTVPIVDSVETVDTNGEDGSTSNEFAIRETVGQQETVNEVQSISNIDIDKSHGSSQSVITKSDETENTVGLSDNQTNPEFSIKEGFEEVSFDTTSCNGVPGIITVIGISKKEHHRQTDSSSENISATDTEITELEISDVSKTKELPEKELLKCEEKTEDFHRTDKVTEETSMSQVYNRNLTDSAKLHCSADASSESIDTNLENDLNNAEHVQNIGKSYSITDEIPNAIVNDENIIESHSEDKHSECVAEYKITNNVALQEQNIEYNDQTDNNTNICESIKHNSDSKSMHESSSKIESLSIHDSDGNGHIISGTTSINETNEAISSDCSEDKVNTNTTDSLHSIDKPVVASICTLKTQSTDMKTFENMSDASQNNQENTAAHFPAPKLENDSSELEKTWMSTILPETKEVGTSIEDRPTLVRVASGDRGDEEVDGQETTAEVHMSESGATAEADVDNDQVQRASPEKPASATSRSSIPDAVTYEPPERRRSANSVASAERDVAEKSQADEKESEKISKKEEIEIPQEKAKQEIESSTQTEIIVEASGTENFEQNPTSNIENPDTETVEDSGTPNVEAITEDPEKGCKDEKENESGDSKSEEATSQEAADHPSQSEEAPTEEKSAAQSENQTPSDGIEEAVSSRHESCEVTDDNKTEYDAETVSGTTTHEVIEDGKNDEAIEVESEVDGGNVKEPALVPEAIPEPKTLVEEEVSSKKESEEEEKEEDDTEKEVTPDGGNVDTFLAQKEEEQEKSDEEKPVSKEEVAETTEVEKKSTKDLKVDFKEEPKSPNKRTKSPDKVTRRDTSPLSSPPKFIKTPPSPQKPQKTSSPKKKNGSLSPVKTPKTPGSDPRKLPPIKAPVGLAPNPNLKNIRSKIGSFDNIRYKPGGGDKKVISSKKLEWNSGPKIGSLYHSCKNDKKRSHSKETKEMKLADEKIPLLSGDEGEHNILPETPSKRDTSTPHITTES